MSLPAVKWIAYRLELQHPQRLHRLVIDAAANGGESAGISLLEPNGPACFALDSGVAAGPSLEISTDRTRPRIHRRTSVARSYSGRTFVNRCF